jgi:ketosteroid isomerase-like protein
MTDNQKIVQSWFDLIADGKAAEAFALFSEDIVYDLKGTTPVSGKYRGMDQIVNDFFTPWRKQLDGEMNLIVDELIGDGASVVALVRGEAKTIFDKRYDNEYAFVFRIKDGKITGVTEYLDTALVETAAYGKKIA